MRAIQIGNRKIIYRRRDSRSGGIRLVYQPGQDPPFSVHAPRHCPQERIDAFLRGHEKWILRQAEAPVDTSYRILGKECRVYLERGKRDGVRLGKGEVHYAQRDPDDEEVTEKLTRGIWKAVLQQYVEGKREEYERVTGKKGVRFFYRDMTSRFGSCTPAKGKITLNLQLARMDPELIDGVVYHEYSHFQVPCHSPEFYRVLAQYCPDWKERRKRLRPISFCNPARCVKMNAQREGEKPWETA